MKGCIDCRLIECECRIIGWAIRTSDHYGRLWLAEPAGCPETGSPRYTDQWEKRHLYKFRAFAEDARAVVGQGARLVRVRRRFVTKKRRTARTKGPAR